MAKSGIGDILHFGAVRFRIVGSGSLIMYLRSLDDVRNQQLVDLTMQSVTNREPVVLANFKEQCAQLELSVTEIDETFTIGKIIIFTKATETGYPQ